MMFNVRMILERIAVVRVPCMVRQTPVICLLLSPWHFDRFVSVIALREESSQTNVILQYTLLASILIAVCSVIQQS